METHRVSFSEEIEFSSEKPKTGTYLLKDLRPLLMKTESGLEIPALVGDDVVFYGVVFTRKIVGMDGVTHESHGNLKQFKDIDEMLKKYSILNVKKIEHFAALDKHGPHTTYVIDYEFC